MDAGVLDGGGYLVLCLSFSGCSTWASGWSTWEEIISSEAKWVRVESQEMRTEGLINISSCSSKTIVSSSKKRIEIKETLV